MYPVREARVFKIKNQTNQTNDLKDIGNIRMYCKCIDNNNNDLLVMAWGAI